MGEIAVQAVRFWIPKFGLRDVPFTRHSPKQREAIMAFARELGVKPVDLTRSQSRMSEDDRREKAIQIIMAWMREKDLFWAGMEDDVTFEKESAANVILSGAVKDDVRELFIYVGQLRWKQYCAEAKEI